MFNRMDFLDVCSGNKKADLVLKNCKIINCFLGEIEENDIAIQDGYIAGIGRYEGVNEIDIGFKYVSPGFIDSHVHIESSLLTPSQFAKAILPNGTTTIICDPHEIANVCGISGIKYVLDSSKNLPLNVYVMLPSCVPATPFENSGAIISSKELKELMGIEGVLGLGEMMNYPGVIYKDEEVHRKLELFKDMVIDGHCPGLSGKLLNSYISNGIKTDHECTSIEEMNEKLSRGMYINIREGSAAKDLGTLIKGVTKNNERRITFCTDDKHPEDIIRDGHINYNIKLAIKNGINPISAIKMATINTAECYGLKNLGAIAPGYIADLVILDDLVDFNILSVYKNGNLVAENKKLTYEILSHTNNNDVVNTVHVEPFDISAFNIKLKSNMANIISLQGKSIITKKVQRKIDIENNSFSYNKNNGINKIAVIERHKFTGNIGLALVENYGLKNGAIALTIAHDSHNIIVIGANDNDMLCAVNELIKMSGGIVICENSSILGSLPLEVGGLMTEDSIDNVVKKLKKMKNIAFDLGVNESIDPFVSLSFLALPVIPELKITDIGLFDTTLFKFIDINID